MLASNNTASLSPLDASRTARNKDRAMKSYRQELWFELPRRRQLVNITAQVEQCLRESDVQEGLCLVNTTRFPGG